MHLLDHLIGGILNILSVCLCESSYVLGSFVICGSICFEGWMGC